MLLRTASVLVLAASPAWAASSWTPERALQTKRVTGALVSPDGRRVAYVVAAAVMEGEKSDWLSQIHVASRDGSNALQLTRGDKSSSAPAWSPDGRWIAFLSSRSGKANLWRIPVDGGEAEQLTDEKGGVTALRFSPDGRTLAFLMPDPKSDEEEKADKEKRDARVVDENEKPTRLYVVPVEKDKDGKRPVRKLTTSGVSLGSPAGPFGFNWSPDGKRIAFTHQPTPKIDDWPKADVSLVDVASASVTPLAATRAAESDPFFSRDGRSVAYYASNDPPTWRRRGRVLLAPAGGGAPKTLGDTPDSQPDIVGFSADGSKVVVAETDRTVSRLFAVPVDGGPAAPLTPADRMVDGASLNGPGTHLGFTSQAPDAPAEAFTSALDTFSPAQASRVQEAVAMDIGRTEVVTWKAPDGKAIEGLLTYPAGYAAGTKVPLLVIVHGGPAGVFTRSFTGSPSPHLVAAFASKGYALLRCNVRGSSGYGFDFRNANYRDWGGGDYKDIMSGVDSLIAKGVADPDRLGVMGWSYGGYMTSWVITQTKRFKAASVGAGVTNLMSFTGTADIPGFLPDYFGGEFWDVFELWRTHSAMFNVKGVTTPTLIQHGEADLRVPISQGYELYNALKRQGVTTRMVTYPRQPHGIQEPKLMLDAMQRNLEWFDRFLLGRGAETNSSH
jgi:dipeptidyl aminopeptidase/acylaminoacyl peptidase